MADETRQEAEDRSNAQRLANMVEAQRRRLERERQNNR